MGAINTMGVIEVTTVYVNEKLVTKEELPKIEIRNAETKRVFAEILRKKERELGNE